MPLYVPDAHPNASPAALTENAADPDHVPAAGSAPCKSMADAAVPDQSKACVYRTSPVGVGYPYPTWTDPFVPQASDETNPFPSEAGWRSTADAAAPVQSSAWLSLPGPTPYPTSCPPPIPSASAPPVI